MALSTLAREQENFLRYAILIVDHSKGALQDLVELNLKNKHLTFHKFLNQNQHEIYHLCYDSRCCQCQNTPLRRKRIIFPPQLELLFDKYNKLPLHKGTGHNDFCCSYAKVGITSQVLDLSLARCLLVNCCLDVFWYICLTAQGQTLEQFLNLNKHTIYHLWKNNKNCCQCPSGFIFPSDSSIISEHEWKSMFNSQLSPCENHRKRISSGSSSICSVGATPGIATQDINPEIQRFILQKCSHISKAVDFLVEQRNLRFAHVPEAKISDRDFKVFLTDIETHLRGIARVCGKETHVKKILRDLHLKPLSINMLSKYEKLLHKHMEAINKNVASEHQKTRKNVSYKIRKLEDRIESLETSSIEIKEDVQGLRKLITDRSKRSQLIRETLAEIDNHRKDQTYTEIKAVTACVQMLDHSKVVILTGREGSGKSRNSLEILRQMKEKHPETDVIKLKRLTQFSDIIKEDAMTIVMFEDVFGRITKQFCENTDVQILDTVYSYVSLGNVRAIFVMRNNVKHQCQGILSSHAIFCNSIAYLDLNSEKFGLSLKEKERLFINYCTKHDIDIIYRKKSSFCDIYDISIDKIKVSIVDKSDVTSSFSADNKCIVFESRAVDEMIRSDPYQGFPQSCRLFTQNKKLTMLGAPFFKYPSKSLLQEIDNMRMEGIDNNVKGLKYVILVYILLNQDTSAISIKNDDHEMLSINENNIDVQAHEQLFNECYNKHFGLKLHDIIYLYDELTGRYLVRKDQKIYFQHLALQDSVLISYCKINPKAIISLLSIAHIIDLVRPQNYMEQEEEIVIKITKIYYPELAVKIIPLTYRDQRYGGSYRYRFMESKIISDNDDDLMYELITFINNAFETSLPRASLNVALYTCHFFPLYLLRNLEKLNDKKSTVNHTQYQMLISVTIRDKNVNLRVDPDISLSYAFRSKYIDITEWLLKNTDHSLLDFKNFVTDFNPDRILEYTKLLLQNVKHEMIDITQLFMNICYRSNNEENHAIDWMKDNVDNSLIDYDKCIQEMLGLDDMDVFVNVLQSLDPELFEKEELINKLNMVPDIDDDEECWNKIVRLILPWMKYGDFNRFVEKADNFRWYGVLESLIIHVTDLSIDIVKLIEKIFKRWDDDYEEELKYDYEHMEKVFRLMLKHHIDNIGVEEIIMDKACHVGSHCVIEELLLDKFDNVSYYLNMTLDKCLSLRFDEIYLSNDEGYEKLLILFLQRVNIKFIDLDSLMSDLCNIGHSSAVLWLLENNYSYCFDLRNVMNKASYHGDLKLVEYLKQKYKTGNFDYKTAMIKACRNSQEKTIDVCKWLWANTDRDLFDMKVALNNASRCGNYEVVEWILTDVDKKLFDTEAALFCACEHGSHHTVKLLLDKSRINTFNFQHAITLAFKNENSGFKITKLLYERADKSTIDIHVVFSVACKNYRSDIAQWIIETCDQNITVTETSEGNKNVTTNPDKNLVDKNHAIICILDMNDPNQKRERVDETKCKLLWIILEQSDPDSIDVHKLLKESCKRDWVQIVKWIHRHNAFTNIHKLINVACQHGAYETVKWSLENIDLKLIDVNNVMVESCGYGWLECLVLVQQQCNQCDLQAAMAEACNYGHLHIVEWLLQNFYHGCFNPQLLLREAGRNGWINVFRWLVGNYVFKTSNKLMATKEALVNGKLGIVKLMFSRMSKSDFDISDLPEKTFTDSNNEEVVSFLLHHCDPIKLDTSTIMKTACKFGWTEIVQYILDKKLFSSCDLNLAFAIACENGESEIVKALADKCHLQSLKMEKTMISVCIKGWDEVALLLLDKFEHTRLDIANALIEACRHGEIDVAQAILRKVKHTLLDVKTALDKACENHMHEKLVLLILENINQNQVDLKTVKKQATRHKWREVQCTIPWMDTEDLNEAEQDTDTDFIVIS